MPTSTEYNLLRGDGHRIKLYLSVSQPRTLLQGQVNGSPARGAMSIPYDTGTGTGFASIKAGQVLRVFTITGVKYVRIRSITGSQSSGTIGVAANSIVWADNQVIHVLEDYPFNHKVPRFVSSGTFYKDWDVTYTDQNKLVKPVTVAGPHRAAFLEGGSATFTFDLNDSYPMAEDATISSFSLSVSPSSGVTITNPSPGIYEVEVTQPGQYWVEAGATDSNSKQQLTRRRLFVYDPSTPTSGDYPYTDLAIDTFHGDWGRGGFTLGLTVRNADPATFPEEALVVLWYEIWYGSTKVYIGGPDNAQNILFAGYIKSGSIEANWEDSTVKFEAATVEDRLKETLMYAVSLAAKRNPAKWYEYLLELTPGRAIHHLLSEHSTLLEMADVLDLDLTELLRKYAEIQQGNLYGMAEQMATSLAGHLCCDNAGRLRFQQDAQLLNDTDRAALPTVATLIPGTDCRVISLQEQPPKVALVTVSGLAFNGQTVNAYCAKSPGEVPIFPGSGTLNIDRQVLEDQDHANWLAGRHHARANNPYPEVRLSMPGGWIGLLDIARQGWWTITLDGTETARGIVWTDKKLILRTVSFDIDPLNGGLSIEATFEPEALGPDGVPMACISELPSTAETGVPRWENGGDDASATGNLQALYAFVDEGSGVYYRDQNDADWAQMDSTPAHHGEIDPWWMTRFRNSTYNPLGAILWSAQSGAIYRSPDGGVTWVDVTPTTDPPNAWSDTPAPTVADLQFVCVKGNMFLLNWFYVLARWENGSGDYRGWLLWTEDNGVSWSWKAIHTSNEVYPIYLAISLGGSANIWMTYLRGSTLYLSKGHPLTPDTFTETSLGSATITEVLDRDKWAFPVVAYGDDNLVFVAGRMDAPAGLAGVRHIIKSTDAAGSFSSVENGWGADHCAAMLVGADAGSGREYYAVRQG